MKSILFKKLSYNITKITLSVLASVAVMTVFAYAASTVGTNFSVEGTLSVTATSTLATTTVSNVISNSLATSANYVVFLSGGTTYVRDGLDGSIDYSNTDPETAIEWAMNNLTAGRTWKEKIIVKGNYTIDTSIDIPSYTILEMQGKITMSNAFPNYGAFQNSDLNNGNSHIEITGGSIDGNYANQTGFKNCIYFEKVSFLKVSNMTIYDCLNEGIESRSNSKFVISGNVIYNNGDDSISLISSGTGGGASNNGTVSNNTVWGNRNDTGGSSGIEIEDGSYEISVFGNVIYGGTTGSNMVGIHVVVDNGSSFPAPHDITITGNIVRAVENSGIFVQTNLTGGDLKNITITGNTVTDTGNNGINVMGKASFNGVPVGVSIVGNTVSSSGTSTSGVYGIYISYAKNVIVSGNTVTESGGHGVYLYYVQGAEVIGNIIFDNGNTDTTTAFGVAVSNTGSNNITITGNIISDTQSVKTQDGISIQFATTNIMVNNNNLSNVRATAYTTGNGGVAKVKDNRGYKTFEGQLFASTTDVGNVGTGEDVLITNTIPANTLFQIGDSIDFVMAFTFAANTNNKKVRIFLDNAAIYDSGTQAENGTELIVKGTITRTDTNAEDITITTNGSTTLMDADFGDFLTAARYWTNDAALKAYGTGTANNDVVQNLMLVNFKSVP